MRAPAQDRHRADLADAEDDDPAEEGADAEPSLGSREGVKNQERAWRGPADDLESDTSDDEPSLGAPETHSSCYGHGLSRGQYDTQVNWASGASDEREWDEAERGIGDLDGLLEQTKGEPSLGATEVIDQRRAWRDSSWWPCTDGEMQGTEDDLALPSPSIEQREAQIAAARDAKRRLAEVVRRRAQTFPRATCCP